MIKGMRLLSLLFNSTPFILTTPLQKQNHNKHKRFLDMDRLSVLNAFAPFPGETQLVSEPSAVAILDDHHKTKFTKGSLYLTTHRLLWTNAPNLVSINSKSSLLALELDLVVLADDESKQARFALHLKPNNKHGHQGLAGSGSSCVRFVLNSKGAAHTFFVQLQKALEKRIWLESSQIPRIGAKTMRSGIAGIEKSLEAKSKVRGSEISKAFQDLDQLIKMARPMVKMAKDITQKLKDKEGGLSSEDAETAEFKSHLLSLGIDDPVTRDAFGSEQKYFYQLAKEMCTVLETPIKETGGIMTLTDAYCRLNRARGLELVSPDDLVRACRFLNSDSSMSLLATSFPSGVKVLKLASNSDEAIVEKTIEAVNNSNQGLTAEEMATLLGISVILAKQRLLQAEELGKIVRDDALQALSFFPNRFLDECN